MEHEIHDGPYCVRCGASVEELFSPADEQIEDFSLVYKVRLAWTAIPVGVAMVGLATLLRNRVPQVPFAELTADQASNYQYAYILSRLGFIVFFAGVVSLWFLPSLKNRRY